jgi:N-acetyl-anhydromuramyl-L-alanine amidase AmpD
VRELHRMIKAEYPDIELVTHEQVAMPRGRKTDPTKPWKTAVWPRVLADWNKGDEMSEEQIREIVRDEIAKATEMVHESSHVAAAQQMLVDKGLLQAGRKTTQAASISYVDLMLARVLARFLPLLESPPK